MKATEFFLKIIVYPVSIESYPCTTDAQKLFEEVNLKTDMQIHQETLAYSLLSLS